MDDADAAREARLEAELLTPPYRARQDQGRQQEFSSPQENMDAGESRFQESRFLRSQQRIPARRRGAQRGQILRWLKISAAVIAIAAVAVLGGATRNFLRHDARFHLSGSAAIEVEGNQIVTRPAVVRLFAGDIGRSVFMVPLETRKEQIEKIEWVHTATVMRLWPNRLRVAIVERTPVAYLRDGSTIRMVDADGVVLAMPSSGLTQMSFPVVTGLAASTGSTTSGSTTSGSTTSVAGVDALTDASTAAEQRAEKMHLYLQFLAALDAGGGKNSQSVSEVNMADSEDIRAVISDGSSDVLVHFGDNDFLSRYQAFVAHRAEWLRQYPRLASVDMRYGRQVVLKMASGDSENATGQAAMGQAVTGQTATANLPAGTSQNHAGKGGH